MLTWPAKDPNEVLDYQVRWVDNRLEAGETITASTFTVEDGSVVIESQTHAGGIATVWLSGGATGEACVLNNRIVTSAGRTYDQPVKLRIRGLT
jgi:hypothetical protein